MSSLRIIFKRIVDLLVAAVDDMYSRSSISLCVVYSSPERWYDAKEGCLEWVRGRQLHMVHGAAHHRVPLEDKLPS